MCHPGLPPGCAVRQQADVAAPSPSPSSVPRARQAAAHHYCVCSPTAHRGSFRCRRHRSGFEWGHRRPVVANTPGRAEAGPAMRAQVAAP